MDVYVIMVVMSRGVISWPSVSWPFIKVQGTIRIVQFVFLWAGGVKRQIFSEVFKQLAFSDHVFFLVRVCLSYLHTPCRGNEATGPHDWPQHSSRYQDSHIYHLHAIT